MTVHIFNDESLGYTLNIKDLINLDMTNRFRYDTAGQHDDGGLKCMTSNSIHGQHLLAQ
jgi:hypothetical protein